MTVTIWRYDDNSSDDGDAKKLILTLAANTVQAAVLCGCRTEENRGLK